MDPVSADGIDFEEIVKLAQMLRHPDLNVIKRIGDLEVTSEASEEIIKDVLKRLLKAETELQVLKSYGHINGRKLNEARARALTKHFQDMTLSSMRLEKSMNSSEIIDFFENEAPEFLRILELKNPHKTVSDIRKKCVDLYPKNYFIRKSQSKKCIWLLIYKD
jgi:hypothetical protein